MIANHIVYLELPGQDLARCKDFYASVFGWSFKDFGPSYTAFSSSGLDGGFNADDSEKTSKPLPVIATQHIEAMLTRIVERGGAITQPIMAFPGGRRFHFLDTEGNELAVMQPDAP